MDKRNAKNSNIINNLFDITKMPVSNLNPDWPTC